MCIHEDKDGAIVSMDLLRRNTGEVRNTITCDPPSSEKRQRAALHLWKIPKEQKFGVEVPL
jgi:hypothetical protein